MTINDDAKVTMTGKEFKDLLNEIDQAKQAFEDIYPKAKQHSNISDKLVKSDAFNKVLLRKTMELDSYKVSLKVLHNINKELKQEIVTLRDSLWSMDTNIAIYKKGEYNNDRATTTT